MKTKLFILIFLISSFRIFASNSLEVSYKADNIRINYFLGYQEEILLPDISENEKYKNLENILDSEITKQDRDRYAQLMQLILLKGYLLV